MKSLLVLVLLGLTVSAEMLDYEAKFYQKVIDNLKNSEQAKQAEEPTVRAPNPNCPNLGGGTSTSVHALKVQDVSLIGAIGDSLTAANGAKAWTAIGLLSEDRGVAWSIGCETGITRTLTFATILQTMSPSLYGCSVDTCDYNHASSRLNLAVPGAVSFDMLNQAKLLVSRIAATSSDHANRWKVINFFIGGNDLCDSCKDVRQTRENFKKNLIEVLDYFQANLRRTLVNLVLTLDVMAINDVPGGWSCKAFQNSFCDCAKTSNPVQINTMHQMASWYQNDILEYINTGVYDNDALFTVVAHKFMTKMRPPTNADGSPDYSYLAPDCFHFSKKGHEAAGVELWNSMMTPNQLKTTEWNIGSAVKCPSMLNPYIYTNKNSASLKSLLVN